MTYSNKFKNVVKQFSGKTIDIPKIFKISRSTYYNWKKPLTQKSRKLKITPKIKCHIRQYVLSRSNFCYKILIKNISRKFNIKISKSSIYSIIKAFGITKKKISKKVSYMKKRKLNKLINQFKKNVNSIDKDNIISIDETSIDTHISNNYGWSQKGTRIYKINNNTRLRYTLILAVSNKKIIHYKLIRNSANKNIFLEFIEEINQKINSTNKTFLLLDNAVIHHAKIIKQYIQNNSKKLELLFNVPYMPEFNPIEFVFNELKTILKKYNNTNKNIKQNIIKSISKLNIKNLSRYFNKSLSFN